MYAQEELMSDSGLHYILFRVANEVKSLKIWLFSIEVTLCFLKNVSVGSRYKKEKWGHTWLLGTSLKEFSVCGWSSALPHKCSLRRSLPVILSMSSSEIYCRESPEHLHTDNHSCGLAIDCFFVSESVVCWTTYPLTKASLQCGFLFCLLNCLVM